MRRNFILEKFIALLFISSSLYAQKMELRAMDIPRSGIRGIANNGNAVMIGYTYNYETNSFVKIDNGIISYANMNEKGDIVGTSKINDLVHPVYKLAGTTEWVSTGVFPNLVKDDAVTVYSISSNGRYIVGQMKSVPFIYDIQTKELKNIIPNGYKYGAGYSVNNEGTTVGWIDADLNGTFRELAVIKKDGQLEKLLTDYAIPINNHIWHVDDNGIAVGEVGLKPFMYNLNTNEYKIFDLPAGYRTGTFISSSNGILVGYVQNMVSDRDAIIYHSSLGDQPKLIKDLLIEQGIEVTIPGGKLGTASVVSENGDFIGGNEIGNGNLVPGWIVKLNGYFDTKECNITVPSDIEVQSKLGETSVAVNYEVTSDCPDYKLVLVNGLESGAKFPMGITTVAYNLVDAEGKVINSASFKVYVKDSYCTPRFTAIVEPITKVKIGTIDNTTTNYVTANENEYFLDQSTDLKQGGTYDITVAGNTNGITETSEFVVYFDLNQDGIFNPDTEGYYVGAITGSTGADGKTVTKSVTLPENAKLGKTRMRIMKTYRLVPDNPCSTTYAYGQSEDYSVNFIENLGMSDINSKDLKIYPNPVKNILSIDSKSMVKNVRIINMAGQEVYNKQLNKMNPQVNVSHLPKGVYIINIETTEGIVTQKIIKD
ncbi:MULTISPECIES: T9SS type A sorting domain-containing protein [Empedobacter]|uniref:T9SS type A sorting domain-containing protein n=1 Tax=Empedobacter falsenii TaxID=343874 RepID=A0A7H9DXA2_9FLAO|nr:MULTISPECIES: GEVED domain-containing protein [Empedobacter]MDH2207037.1 GEVED domain-containing protein [Empedobacter sp. GD03644]QLL59326.1 T9SS type A sorting domain-containing protein [Empedobacter falsenii]